MEEKKIVYDVILSIWNLAKEHGFERLTDEQWESLIEKSIQQNAIFRQHGRNIELLYRGMFDSLQSYYERKKNGEG